MLEYLLRTLGAPEARLFGKAGLLFARRTFERVLNSGCRRGTQQLPNGACRRDRKREEKVLVAVTVVAFQPCIQHALETRIRHRALAAQLRPALDLDLAAFALPALGRRIDEPSLREPRRTSDRSFRPASGSGRMKIGVSCTPGRPAAGRYPAGLSSIIWVFGEVRPIAWP